VRNKQFGKLYGIGVGPGDPSMLTLKALDVLRSVDIIFEAVGKNSPHSISARIVDTISDISAEKKRLIFSMSRSHKERRKMWKANAEVVAESLRSNKNVAFITIGDPLIYSTFTYLMQEVIALIPDIKIETVPGITSFQYTAAKLNKALVEDEETLLLIPAWKEHSIDKELAKSADTVVCLKSYKSRNSIIDALQQSGKNTIIYAEKVGMDEEIITQDIEEIKSRSNKYISHIIGKNKK